MYNGYCNLNKSRGNKMNLTEQQMIEIIKNKQINDCSEEEKKQVMIFAFGEDYMESNDKSSKKTYRED
tara:strand:+ start:586 stop:789 length:204 start_codon:yes stop_codon:yes gene_type:complete